MDLKIEETINFVHLYAPNIIEWKILKKELLKCLPSSHRKLFSTRDLLTKKIDINEVEKSIIEHWKKISNVELYLDNNDISSK